MDFTIEPTKRERKRNFSTDEIRILIEEYENHKDILESKFTNTVTNAKKIKIWKSIEEKLNSLGHERRSLGEIKAKWKNICSSAKSSWNDYKRKREKTGGGPAPKPLSTEEQQVVEMFQGQPRFEGLEGYSSFQSENDVNSIAVMESVIPTSSSSETSLLSVEADSSKSLISGKGNKKKRKLNNDVTDLQVTALKRETIIQKWKLKNLKLVNQKLLCDLKNSQRESELFELQKSKLQLELAILQTNLTTVIGNSVEDI